MVSLDPYLTETFPDPPLVAYKRVKNIRNWLIRAKVSKPGQTKRRRWMNGNKKCTNYCIICPYVKETKEVKGTHLKWKMKTQITCQSSNLVNMISCQKENCKLNYISESERTIKDRICEHLGYIRTKKVNQATGYHFNLPGHSQADLKVIGLEWIFNRDPLYRKDRESYIIRKFNTFYSGMNRLPWGADVID